ncbi:serine/threonine-protein kinase [Parafrankia sp. EUN1f]|uniref:serine/threonine-protein kinase n=1 Tax=Parafrankia sp. EUN1f TaxID=102897 RepID=UPI0001C46D91|nr:serine/threonine-protein kinase [Parafrankia sp. EUN1f]EFC79731.1 serine/threonine protein kinase [Parafrankia sp. EUN1f]
MPAVDRARIARALPRYTLGEELGAGSFGLVLAGHHLDLDRAVAIKVVPAASAAEFRDEARILSRLDHPHIVRIHDYVVLDDLCLLIMEMLGGGTLAQHRHRLSAEATLGVGAAVADGLAHAHAHGVLHRDIKPDNILFTEAGQPKITDFGIGRILDGAPGTVSQAAGTPRYMAPEQITGGRAGPAADLYALGVVLYELVSGRPVFDPGLSVPELLRHQCEVDPPVPAGVPPAVCDVILRALAKDPARRPPDAAAFARAISAAAADVFGPDWQARSGLVLALTESARSTSAAGLGPVARFAPPRSPAEPTGAGATVSQTPGPSPTVEPSGPAAPQPHSSHPSHPGLGQTKRPEPRNLFEGTRYAPRGGRATRRGRVTAVTVGVAAVVLAVAITVGLVVTRGTGSGPPPVTAGTEPGPAPSSPALPLRLDDVRAWAIGPRGGFYVVDRAGLRVLRLDLDGTLSAVAGTGVAGSTGDGGPATAARLRGVSDVAAASDGSVFLADSGNGRIRRIGPDGVITTVAGGGERLATDGAQATEVSLSLASGPIAVDTDGTLYLAGAGRLFRLDRAGVLHLVGRTEQAGGGDVEPSPGQRPVPAVGQSIGDVEVRDGRLYVVDYTTGRVQVLEPDEPVRTLAGGGPAEFTGDGGPATAAGLTLGSGPSSLALDPVGNLFFPEPSVYRVRRVDTRGVITTVAGTGEYGSDGDGGPATAARLASPARVAVDTAGVLYIGEVGTAIRRVGLDAVISTVHD